MSYTEPQPLSQPAQVPVSPQNLLLLAAANATNATAPHIVTGIAAASTSVDDAVTNSQAATAVTNAQNTADNLKTQPAKIQQTQYESMTASEQSQLDSVGYQPPRPSRSLFGDVVHAASDTLTFAPVKDTLNALGSPLRLVQHGERTFGAALGGTGSSDTGIGHIFTPSDWANAWNATSNGEQYIDPAVRSTVLKKYGTQTYNLAYQLATTGMTAQQLAAAAPQSQQQSVYQALTAPAVKDAAAYLNAGHLTPGHGIVTPGFIARHPRVGNDISGAIDGVFDLFSDPTIVAGKFAKTAKAVRYAVRTGEDVETVYKASDAVKTMFKEIAERVASGSVTSVQAVIPTLKQAASELVAEQADTETKVLQYFKDKANLANILSGSPTNVAGPAAISLPHLSPLGLATLKLKGALTHVIDLAADKPFLHLPASDRAIWDDDDNYLPDGPHPLTPDEIRDAVTPTSKIDRLTVGLGRTARRVLTLEPTSRIFNPNAPDAANVLRDIGLRFLPRDIVDKYLTEYVSDPNIGNKLRVFQSMMLMTGHAAGLDSDPEIWDRVIGRKVATAGRLYAPKGIDVMNVDGTAAHYGISKADMAEHWILPDFKQMWLEGRRAGIMKSLGMAVNQPWLDQFMSVWRPLTLLRFSFGMRVGGEEAAAMILREGIVNYLRTQGAASVYRHAAQAAGQLADTTFESLDDNEAGGVWNRLTSSLPPRVVSAIKTPKDLVAANISHVTRQAFLATGKALAPGPLTDAVNHLIDHDVLSVPDHLNAVHNSYDATDVNNLDGDSYFKTTDKTGHKVNAEIKPGNDYREYDSQSPFHPQMWYHQLSRSASDDWDREALKTARWKSRPQRLQAIAGRLMSDPMWDHAYRSVGRRDGDIIATGAINSHDAAMDHAAVIANKVDHYITSPATGQIIGIDSGESLPDYLLRTGKSPSIDALKNIHTSHWPESVTGPELTVVSGLNGKFRNMTNAMFTKVVGPQINWLSRTPMFIMNYARNRVALSGLAKEFLAAGMKDLGSQFSEETRMEASLIEDYNEEEGTDLSIPNTYLKAVRRLQNVVEDRIHALSLDAAVNQSIQYVHNPELRSEMSVLTRNVSPFWFAQEQFYKRWARTFAYSPDAFRKAQLFSQGLRHAGFIEKDPDTGEEYFVYPGSSLTQHVLASFFSHFGIGADLPIDGGLTGAVNNLSPALSNGPFRPSFGPFVSVSLKGLQSIDPHFHAALRSELTGDALGGIANSQGFLASIFPATLVHAAQFADPNLATAQYASTQLQAIQAMEATGKGLAFPAITQVASITIANPKPGDYVQEANNGPAAYVYQPDGTWKLNSTDSEQALLDSVRKYSRVMFLTRLIFGFSAPASPTVSFNPDNLNTEYRQLTNALPLDVAASTFLAEHPDATAETIGQTSATPGTSSIPETNAAMSFLGSNPSLLSKHSLAAAYFIPAPASTAKYSYAAYQEQLLDGLRAKDTPQQFLNEVIYQQAANIFFPVQNQKYAMLAADPSQSATVDSQFDQWSQQFMTVNPTFANLYNTTDSSAGSAETRQAIMHDVGSALSDGSAPSNPQTAAVNVIYNTWVQWQEWRGDYGGVNAPTVSTTQADQVDEQYALFLNNYVAQNPGVQPLVDRAIRPDLDNALTTLAGNGQALSF